MKTRSLLQATAFIGAIALATGSFAQKKYDAGATDTATPVRPASAPIEMKRSSARTGLPNYPQMLDLNLA